MPIWIRAAVFIGMLPAAIAGWIPWAIDRPHPAAPAAHQIGLALVTVGWGILLWCALDFGRRGNGTPAPYDPPRALVTSGLYAHARNPMYVGLLTAILGWALWFWSGWVAFYFVFMALAFHARVLLYEEAVLTRSFGADFARYRATVPRWIPRLSRQKKVSQDVELGARRSTLG
jgi:protein-S-isoprenylcysteine O-methyltransferase Ste14